LLLDNGMFFEFVPLAEAHDLSTAHAVPIWEVRLGTTYAIVVSTNSGLWRFVIGDTVEFTSLRPYRIKIKGRTKLFVNAFGEEVVIENTDSAIAKTCEEFGVTIKDYTVAPLYLDTNTRGRHDWFVEFTQTPTDLAAFTRRLDEHLRARNSYYDAKRSKDIALENLRVYSLPLGTFHSWLAQKGKLGGQYKVPRLSNDRKIAEEIVALMNN
ncbi:MAG: GH3 auxin-responsive promoter family protein, partial [Bacteroidota bacterium]